MEFIHKPWSALSVDELYAILALRAEVFVVEQRCAYQDLDDGDRLASHLWIPDATGRPLAYARLFEPGAREPAAVIGRIVSAPAVRRRGYGRVIVAEALRRSVGEVAIGAQKYLTRFYESFGFVRSGADYLEDGIVHLPMRRPPPAGVAE